MNQPAARFGRPYLRAIQMDAEVDLLDCERQFHSAAALLADAPSESYGGGGTTFDWGRVPLRRTKPLVLSGGLEPRTSAMRSGGCDRARSMSAAESKSRLASRAVLASTSSSRRYVPPTKVLHEALRPSGRARPLRPLWRHLRRRDADPRARRAARRVRSATATIPRSSPSSSDELKHYVGRPSPSITPSAGRESSAARRSSSSART